MSFMLESKTEITGHIIQVMAVDFSTFRSLIVMRRPRVNVDEGSFKG